MEKPKILFIHNKCMWYRRPFFNKLAEEYNVEYLFTDEKKVEGLKAKHEILKRYGIYPFSFAFGLISRLIKRDFNIVVFPPPDSLGELIDNVFCFLMSNSRRKPYFVLSERGSWKKKISLAKWFYIKISHLLTSFIACNSSAFFVPGIKYKEYPLSLGVSFEKIFILPCVSGLTCSDKDYEKGGRLKKELGIENKKIILYVGRLIKRKGADYLIRAFAKVRKERDDVVLVIVGDEYFGRGKDYCGDELKSLCKDLGVHDDVYFIGEIKHDALAPYYILGDVFVMPGITYRIAEPWGLVLNEAMSFGKPVIATDAVGAAYELIRDGVNGFMVPEKDVNALYKTIKKIIENPELGRKMGEESKRIIEEGFSYEHMVNGFKKAIKYVLG